MENKTQRIVALMKVSFCSFNDQKEEVINIIMEKYPQLEISVTRCLYCCGECSERPIARVKGQLFVGKDAEDLVSKLLEIENS